jgi:hypothetical protein
MSTMNDNGVHTKLTDITGELRGETEKALQLALRLISAQADSVSAGTY